MAAEKAKKERELSELIAWEGEESRLSKLNQQRYAGGVGQGAWGSVGRRS